MKPIHKFNGGKGATLCHTCRVIISVGLTDDLYCNKCNKMKHNLIKTDNYLLVVDDSEIKEGNIVYVDCSEIEVRDIRKVKDYYNEQFLFDGGGQIHINYCKKIIAHLSLNGAPVLEGVPLLPRLPKEDDVDYWIHETVSSLKDEHTIKTSSICLKAGYNKAKEKYKYTEEDLVRAWTAGMEYVGEDKGSYKEFIQSLQHHPKYPIAFECDTEWMGKYIYE